MTQHSHEDGCCHDQSATPKSVYQTLDEMDFERGLWSAAVDGDLERVQKFLLDKKVDPDVLDKSGLSPLVSVNEYGPINMMHMSDCMLLIY